jgi:hypothetical protein
MNESCLFSPKVISERLLSKLIPNANEVTPPPRRGHQQDSLDAVVSFVVRDAKKQLIEK